MPATASTDVDGCVLVGDVVGALPATGLAVAGSTEKSHDDRPWSPAGAPDGASLHHQGSDGPKESLPAGGWSHCSGHMISKVQTESSAERPVTAASAVSSNKHDCNDDRDSLPLMDRCSRLQTNNMVRNVARHKAFYEHELLLLGASKYFKVRRLVEHERFTSVMGCMILLNALILGLETDHEEFFGRGMGSLAWVLEVYFLVIYSVELSLRFLAYGAREFISDYWNLADAGLILMSFIDTTISALDEDSSSVVSSLVVYLRLLRVIRLLRVLRLVKKLWLIVQGVINSMRAIAWSWFLLIIIIYLFALLITFISEEYVWDPDMDLYFGTVWKSWFTMFQVVTTEGWPDIARITMRHNWLMFLLFFTFLSFSTFSVLNVVVGIFVEGTIAAARKHEEESAMSAKIGHKKEVAVMKAIFMAADTDGSGYLTREELEETQDNPELLAKLKDLQIDLQGLHGWFDLLDYDGSGKVDADEFVQSMLAARGPPTKKDLLETCLGLRKVTKNVRANISEVSHACGHEMEQTRDKIAALATDIGKLLSLLDQKRLPKWPEGDSRCNEATGLSALQIAAKGCLETAEDCDITKQAASTVDSSFSPSNLRATASMAQSDSRPCPIVHEGREGGGGRDQSPAGSSSRSFRPVPLPGDGASRADSLSIYESESPESKTHNSAVVDSFPTTGRTEPATSG